MHLCTGALNFSIFNPQSSICFFVMENQKDILMPKGRRSGSIYSMSKGNAEETPGASPGKKKKFLSWKWIVATAVFAAFVLILVLLPFAMELGAERFLLKNGARSARIMNVDFNPFLGRLGVFGLEVAGPQDGGLELEKLETRLDLWSLFRKRIHIVQTEVVGLKADIRLGKDGMLFIGGFPAGGEEARAQPEAAPVQEKPWELGIGTVTLGGIHLHLVMPGFDETFLIRHLQLERFATWSPDDPGDLNLHVLRDDLSLEVSGTAMPFGDGKALDIQFDLGGFPLEILEPFVPETMLTSLSGRLGVEGEIMLLAGSGEEGAILADGAARSVKGNISITLDDGRVGLILGPSPMQIGQEALSVRMDVSYSDTGTFSPSNFNARTDLSLRSFTLSGGEEALPLLSIGETAARNLQMEGPGKVRAENLSLQDIAVLSRSPDAVSNKEPSEVASLKSLAVADVSLNDLRALQLGEITLDSLSAWILRQEDGSLEALELLPEMKGKEDPGPAMEGADQPEVKGGLEEIAIGRLALTGENSVTFRDLNMNPSVTTAVDSLDLEVTGFQSGPFGKEEPLSVKARTNLNLGRISLLSGPEELPLFEVRETGVNNLQVEGLGNIRTEKVNLKGISVLSRRPDAVQEGEPPLVASIKDLTLRDITLREMSMLHLEEVVFDSLSAWILRKEGGFLEALELLPETRDERGGEEGGGGQREEKEGLKEITLGRLSLAGENSLTFRDLDVKPPVTMEVDSLEVKVTDFLLGSPEGKGSFSLQAGMGKYTFIGIQGQILAPWDNPDLDAQVKVKSFDLPPLTPYTDRYLGYVLNSGHLNLDADINIAQGVLDAQTKVAVNRIEMTPVKEEAQKRAEERLGIPVKTALALLKDKNDNIELNLPVEGNMNDPEFKISDVLLTVTGNALKKGVSAYYKSLGVSILTGGLVPPGTFTVLGQVFKGTTSVSFDPVVFDALASELSAKDEDFLSQMAVSLSEKPSTRLIIIGKVTRQDIMALRRQAPAYATTVHAEGTAGEEGEEPAVPSGEISPAAPETAPQVQPVPMEPPLIEEVPLTDEEKEKLIGIAKKRAENVKNFLVENGGLDPERLFILYSEVEKEADGPPPRVELSI